ncbi:MAG: asparagine synthase-related protein [Acidobacteriota bacterium]
MTAGSVDPGRCGDWLLLGPGARVPGAGRCGEWREVHRAGDRRLLVAQPGPAWAGSPWRAVTPADGGGTRAWLLGESPATDAEVLAAARELGRGVDPSIRLGGRFLLLIERTGSFEVVTDRFNTLHAYRTANGAAVGTSYRAVCAAGSARRLDWPALRGFFTLGFFLGESTHYDDVRCLGPAARHRATEAGDSGGERYWRWSYRPERRRDRRETVDELASRLERAVGAAAAGEAGERLALPISGGLDSRVLVACQPAGSRAWGFSYGYQKGSVEIRLAAEIARRRGLDFESFVVEAYLERELDVVLDAVEGFQDVTQSRQISLRGELARRAGAVLGGHWGDVWLDDAHLDLAASGAEGRAEEELPGRVLASMRKRGHGWLVENVCAHHLEPGGPASGRDPLELAIARGLEELADVEDLDFRVKAFKTDHWSSRWTLASVRAYQAASFPRLPFYDPQLADFFATVATEELRDRSLEIDYLRRHAPDLAAVPWQETGAPLGRSRRRAWWLGLPERAARRAWRTLRRRPVIERNWEVQWLSPGGRTLLRGLLTAPGLRLHDVVPRRSVEQHLEEFLRAPSAANGYSISMLATFAAWLERE